MVSLEQIRALEARVEKAVTLIDTLRRENAELEQRLVEASRSADTARAAYAELENKSTESFRMSTETEALIEGLKAQVQTAEAENAAFRERALAAEQRSFDLESKAEELRREQSRIEEGLNHALQKLDAFEDLVMGISVVESSPAISGEPVESPESPVEIQDSDQLPGTDNELDIF